MSFAPDTDEVQQGGQSEFGEVDEDKLHQAAQRELDSAALWSSTKLTNARADALSAYLGKERGDEREGHSQAVTRDLLEVTELALAFLVDVFDSTERLIEFTPDGEDDVPTAKQATDATHSVFERENGAGVLYDAMKDGFLQKNGVGKVKWERSRSAAYERYQGKSLAEVVQLTADPGFKLRAITAYVEGEDGQRQEVGPESVNDPAMQVLLLFDVSGVRVDEGGHVALDSIAPENFFVNTEAKSLQHRSCRFVAERMPVTESVLIAMGVEPEKARAVPTSTEDMSAISSNAEYRARRTMEDFLPLGADRADSERPVIAYDAYVLVDMDGDGISEWWNLLLGGDYGEELLAYEPAVGHPFVTWSPIPITHLLHGLSFADVVVDLQVNNTTQWRQYLDALFLSTDPTYVVQSMGDSQQNATPLVNLDQLVHAGPGRYVEEYQQGALRTLDQPAAQNAQNLLPSLDLTSRMLQSRTGVSADAMGMDPSKISDHVFGAVMQQSAAAQRLILYARLFARNYVKPFFQLIFRELQLNATTRQMMKVHDEWREIDPSTWTTQVGAHVALPLGHASRAERVSALQTIGSVQKALLDGGKLTMVNDSNLFNTVRDLTEALGFKNVSAYFTDPRTAEPVEPEPSTEEKALALQQEIEALRLGIERQKVEVARWQALADMKKAELDHERDMKELELKYGAQNLPLDDPRLTLGGGYVDRMQQPPPQAAGGNYGEQPAGGDYGA